MKKLILTIVLSTVIKFTIAQNDSNRIYFFELVKKVQNDKSLTGAFMYKGYNATITTWTEYKTTIGKFIQILWMIGDGGAAKYTAIFHNTLGYMTRAVFNTYKTAYKDYKIDKEKYDVGGMIYELRKDNNLPYIIYYPTNKSEIRVIK